MMALVCLVMLVMTACGNTAFQDASGVAEGGKVQADINFKSTLFAQNEDQTVLSLRFVQGDASSGGLERPLDKLPPYEVRLLTHPSRLVVRLSGLAYTGTSFEIPADLPLLQGGFERPAGDDGQSYLYFQLSGAAEFRVEETEGILRIYLRPKISDQPRGLEGHVMVDAFDAFVSGTFPSALTFTPTLDAKGRPVMISPPAEDEDALFRMEAAAVQQLKNAGLTASVWSQWIYENELPLPSASSRTNILTSDLSLAEPVLLYQQERLLSFLDAGSRILAVKADVPSGSVEKETLFLVDADGSRRLLVSSEYTLIQKAAVSPNGNWLAYCAQTDLGAPLFLLNMQTLQVYYLGEDIGTAVSDFAWQDDNTLTMISGDVHLQLRRLDPKLLNRDKSPAVTLEERQVYGGQVAWVGSTLYFSDGETHIYALSDGQVTRQIVDDGVDFAISPSGGLMAVRDYTPDQEALSKLHVRALGTDKVWALEEGREVVDVAFSSDSKRLYYLVYQQETGEMQLMYWSAEDGRSHFVGTTDASALQMGRAPNELLMLFSNVDAQTPQILTYLAIIP